MNTPTKKPVNRLTGARHRGSPCDRLREFAKHLLWVVILVGEGRESQLAFGPDDDSVCAGIFADTFNEKNIRRPCGLTAIKMRWRDAEQAFPAALARGRCE